MKVKSEKVTNFFYFQNFYRFLRFATPRPIVGIKDTIDR